MSNESRTQLQSIDRATLTPLVRQALGSDTVEVTDWDTQVIYGGAGFGIAGRSAIYRVSGRGQDWNETAEWSLILKVLHPPADRGKPSDWNYWRREADAYESGLLDNLSGGLAAPRCFGVVEHQDDTCWIWMEDIRDDIGPEWPLEHYGVVARHLGQFNGAFLTGMPLPSFPWLSSQWLRSNVGHAAPAVAQLQSSLDNPLVRRAYPPDRVDRILHSWAQREQFLDALDRLPQTLCHFDAFRRNLFAQCTSDGLERTVAIDWAFVGIGALGRDIDALVVSTLTWSAVDGVQGKELDQIVFAGYLDGLHDAGWQGDPRQVRFAQIAPLSVRRLIALAYMLPLYLDETRHARFRQTTGHTIAENADGSAERARHHPLAYWGDEARELLDALW